MNAYSHPIRQTRVPREDRRDVALRGSVVLPNGATAPTEITNLSYNGCRIVTDQPLVAGTKLLLAVYSLGVAEVEVKWSRAGRAGLRFKPADRFSRATRRSKRSQIEGSVNVRRKGRQRFALRIFDLSPKGCKLEFVERPKIGETVYVKFGAFNSLEATVCWTDGFFGGVEFSRQIYPAIFDVLVHELSRSKIELSRFRTGQSLGPGIHARL